MKVASKCGKLIPLFEPRWYTPLLLGCGISWGLYLSFLYSHFSFTSFTPNKLFFFFLSRSEATTPLFLDAVTLGIRMKTISFIIIHKITAQRNQVIYEVQFPYFSIGQENVCDPLWVRVS